MSRWRPVRAVWLAAGLTLGLGGIGACSDKAARAAETSSFVVEGLQVIFRHTPGRQHTAFGFYLGGGSTYIGNNQGGIEALLFQAALLGTATRSRQALQARLASLGGHLEAFAGRDHSGLIGLAPNENFSSVWILFTDILVRPRLESEAIEWARRQIMASLARMAEEPHREVLEMAYDTYYKGHAYSMNPLGTVETLGRLTRNDLIQYYREDMTKNRALLVIVGDLEVKEVTRMARKLAREVPRGPEMLLPTSSFDAGRSDATLLRRSTPTHFIAGMFAGPRPGHIEYPPFMVALELLEMRLFEQLRSRRGLADDPRTWDGGHLANYGGIAFATTDPADATKVVRSTIADLIAGPLEAGEVDAAKARVLTAQRMSGGSVVEQLAQLARWGIVAEDWRQLEQFPPELEAVDATDVQTAIRKYMRRIHWAALGPSRSLRKAVFIGR